MSKFYRFQLHPYTAPESNFEPQPLTRPVPATEGTGAIHPRAEARFTLLGKHAIVTGGGRGMGYEAAITLCEHGVSGVALYDLLESSEAPTLLREAFPSVDITYTQVDVADEDSVIRAVDATAKEFGKIDVLLCFAGIVKTCPAEIMDMAWWRKVLDVNVTGTFVTAKAVSRYMIEQQTGGSMVFIASISAHRVNFPQPQVDYNMSKAAIVHMARSLAAEWAIHGIRVNTISPGYMDTALNQSPAHIDAVKQWSERTPMGRIGKKDELNGAVVFLSTPASSFMTGHDLVLDGGYCII